MKLLTDVKKALTSKRKGDAWVEDILPVIVDVNRQIKSIEKTRDEEIEPLKIQVKSIQEKYNVALKPLKEIDGKLKERIMAEYDTADPVKAEGIGEIVFPVSWGFEVVDFSKVPKELRLEVVDNKAVMTQIKAGVRNIKGLDIKPIRSMRVLTKTD